MDSDQTAPKSYVGLYHLKYRLPNKTDEIDRRQKSRLGGGTKGKVNEDHFELLPFFY